MKEKSTLKAERPAEVLTQGYLRGIDHSLPPEAKNAIEQGVKAKPEPATANKIRKTLGITAEDQTVVTEVIKDLNVCVGTSKPPRGKKIGQCPYCHSIVEGKKRTRKGVKETFCPSCGEVIYERA